MNQINNTDGFTLIEAMIAAFVLAVGILAMSLMQIKAIDANDSAFSRSDASIIAQNFIAYLQGLPFTDANLSQAATNPSLDTGAAVAGGQPTPAAAAHNYTNFTINNNAFKVNNTYLEDSSGRKYQLFWNVVDDTVTFGGQTYTPYCTIRLFLYWNSLMGSRHLQLTAIKYNN